MSQDIFEWLLIIGRWLHITVAVTWIGTSIFFMWLDRTLVFNSESKREGHIGELWMVHGGGFYHVEKLQMGPTKVPELLHWFKWESYWTWMSGMFLLVLIFYTGKGTYLLDDAVSDITFTQGMLIALFSVFGSWFFYDFLWERKISAQKPIFAHTLTLIWFTLMTYFLCHTLSGRAAYIHIGAMLGTWMTANVFMRIIPRQIKMVEASKRGEAVNQEWGKNAKNRSTHNTYFTLPVIFIMISNHFPSTYGHDLNWILLILISAAGAAIREYFVVRLQNPKRAISFALVGVAIIFSVIAFSGKEVVHEYEAEKLVEVPVVKEEIKEEVKKNISTVKVNLSGVIHFEGVAPKGKKLSLPTACAKQHPGQAYSDEVIVKDGKLQNVLIRITKGFEGLDFGNIPENAVELDQRGCLYKPRVLAVRVGQPVTFINSDPVFHNVKSVAKINERFNINMPTKDSRETKTFDKSEIFLKTKCNIHPWMGAHIAVIDHPFFAVSDENGNYKIDNLVEGKYTIEAWHEVFGVQTQEIELSSQADNIIHFTFRSKK